MSSGTWVGTNRRAKIDFLDPDPIEFPILDIADALSRQPRFVGLTSETYSVAQHSVLASRLCRKHPLAALLHDAAEAYTGDINRPLKLLCHDLQVIERRLLLAIGAAFNVTLHPLPEEVKAMDDVLLFTERRDFQPGGPEWDWQGPRPLPTRLFAWSQRKSRREFLDRYESLKRNSVNH